MSSCDTLKHQKSFRQSGQRDSHLANEISQSAEKSWSPGVAILKNRYALDLQIDAEPPTLDSLETITEHLSSWDKY